MLAKVLPLDGTLRIWAWQFRGAAVIPGFDPESVAHEPFFGKLMNLGRLWRGGVVVPGGWLVEPRNSYKKWQPLNSHS